MRQSVVLIAAAFALVVAACNTVEGVGRDVSAAGAAVAGAAADVKR